MDGHRLGLCFSGGGAKGAYQIGVWKALEETGLAQRVQAVSGTSIGGINGAFFSLRDLPGALAFWGNIHQDRLLSVNEGKIRDWLQDHTPSGFRPVLEKMELPQLFRMRGIFSPQGLLDLLRAHLAMERFAEDPLPCSVCATRIGTTGEETIPEAFQPRYLSLQGRDPAWVEKALLASAAVPGIYAPVELEGEWLLDGFLVDNTPISPLAAQGCDVVIAVQLDGDANLLEVQLNRPDLILWNLVPSMDTRKLLGAIDFQRPFMEDLLRCGYRDALETLRKMEGHFRASAHVKRSAQNLAKDAEAFDALLEGGRGEGAGSDPTPVPLSPSAPESLSPAERAALRREMACLSQELGDNADALARLAFESIAALSPVESRVRDRARKGLFGRIWGALTGKTLEGLNADLFSLNRAVATSQEMIRLLNEQGALSLDVLGALGNRTRLLQAQLNLHQADLGDLAEGVESLRQAIGQAFRAQESRLDHHGAVLRDHERRLSWLEWKSGIRDRTFRGLPLLELPPAQRVWLCLSGFLSQGGSTLSPGELQAQFLGCLRDLELPGQSLTRGDLVQAAEDPDLRREVVRNLTRNHRIVPRGLPLGGMPPGFLPELEADLEALEIPGDALEVALDLFCGLRQQMEFLPAPEGRAPFDQVLRILEETLQEVPDSELACQIRTQRQQLQEDRLRVPLVGQFSVGKSTLLNEAVLRRELLPRDTTPETSLATELHYSPQERLVSVDLRGGTVEYPLSELSRVQQRASEWLCLQLYLDAPGLKAFPDLCLVDMPGTDSANPAHQKALALYATRGDHFVVVTAPHSQPTASLLYLLRELGQEGKDLSVLLNKKGTVQPDQMEAILESQKRVMAQAFGRTPWMGSTECEDPRDLQDLEDLLHHIQRQYDPHLHRRFDGPVAHLVDQILRRIQNLLESSDDSVEDLGRRMVRLAQERETLQASCLREWGTLRGELEEQGAREVVAACMGVLDREGLVQLLLDGRGSQGVAAYLQERIRLPFDRTLRTVLIKGIRSLQRRVPSVSLQEVLQGEEQALENPSMEQILLDRSCLQTDWLDVLLRFGELLLFPLKFLFQALRKTREEARAREAVDSLLSQAESVLRVEAGRCLRGSLGAMEERVNQALGRRYGEMEASLQAMEEEKRNQEALFAQKVEAWGRELRRIEELTRIPWIAAAREQARTRREGGAH